jgi:RhtB (resistance to homoserine/threonine) family protein
VQHFALLTSLWGFYLLAVMSPGPNTFIVMRLALERSRRAGLGAVLGIALGNAGWLGLVAGGLGLLLEQFPAVFEALRVVGGGYLLYLGLRIFLPRNSSKKPHHTSPSSSVEEEQPFRSGLLASLTNPNTLPFYLSILAPALAPSLATWVRAVAATGILVLAIGWYSFVAWLASHPRARAAYARRERMLNMAMGAMMMLYGLRVLSGLLPQ